MATFPESAVRTSSPDSRENEADRAFSETLGLLRYVLVEHYQIGKEEAFRIESDLSQWFGRFCTRPGTPSPRDCRPYLLLMCCAFARGHQKQMVSTGRCAKNEQLIRLLEREPNQVAGELSFRPNLLYFKLPDSELVRG